MKGIGRHHTRDTKARATAINRQDRRDARRQLREAPESVELRQPRARGLYDSY